MPIIGLNSKVGIAHAFKVFFWSLKDDTTIQSQDCSTVTRMWMPSPYSSSHISPALPSAAQVVSDILPWPQHKIQTRWVVLVRIIVTNYQSSPESLGGGSKMMFARSKTHVELRSYHQSHSSRTYASLLTKHHYTMLSWRSANCVACSGVKTSNVKAETGIYSGSSRLDLLLEIS